MQTDGKLLVAGGFISVGGVVQTNLARLNADGTVDATFHPALAGPNGPPVWSVCQLQSDGKILIAGGFTSVNGAAQTNLARLNPDGTLDGSFQASLVSPSNADRPVECLSVQRDGKILLCGSFSFVNGVARTNPARLNANGTLDDSFLHGLAGPLIDNPPGVPSEVTGLALQDNGKVVIGGHFNSVNGVARKTLARLNGDGTLDDSFLVNFALAWGAWPIVALQADGKILVGATYEALGDTLRTWLARLNADGSLNASFAVDVEARGDLGVWCLLPRPDGKMFVGGGFQYTSSAAIVDYFCRLNANGSLDGTFNTGPTGPLDQILRVAAQPDGRVLIGGQFVSVSGVPRGCVARLLPDGSLDNSFLGGLAGADRAVLSLVVQDDGRILIGGEFSTVNGVPRLGVARLNADGTLDTSFTNDLGGSVHALALQGDGKILAGGYGRANNLARLNADGSVDTTFASSMTGWTGVMCLALQSDGKVLLGGQFTTVNGVACNHLARLNANGSLDSSFNGGSGTDREVDSIAVQGDGKILIGGGFSSVNGVARNGLARLNTDGSLDTAFIAIGGPNTGVDSLAVQSDGKILVGGGFSSLNGVSQTNLARLKPDGSLDNSFLAAADGTVWSVGRQADGRILVGGAFTTINGTPRSYVARLQGDFALPNLVTPPQSQTAEQGSTILFYAEAEGMQPTTYQWWFNGTNALTSATTNSFLTLANVQSGRCGAYTVVVSNPCGAVTSAPAALSVISPVQRRVAPALRLTGGTGSFLHLEQADSLAGAASRWLSFSNLTLSSGPQLCFELPPLLAAQRFFRAWQTNAPEPALDLARVTLIPLTGATGSSVRINCINAIGPTNAWVTLDTLRLTNTTELYFDFSALGKPPRLYRLAGP